MGVILSCRREQLRCASEIARSGWNERGAVLGMGDWFAEEFLIEEQRRNRLNYALTIHRTGYEVSVQSGNPADIMAVMELARLAEKGEPPAPEPKFQKVAGERTLESWAIPNPAKYPPAEEVPEPGLIEPAPGTLASVFAAETAQEDPAALMEAPKDAQAKEKAPKAPPKKKAAPPAPAAAAPAPVAEVIPIPSPSVSPDLKALQDETADLTMAAIGRNRPAVIALMAEYGAVNFSGLKHDMEKLKSFRSRIESIQ